RLVARLDDLIGRLAQHRLARKSSALGWLFGKREAQEQDILGLYIWGDVGRGKTMLMDLFFAQCPVQRKRRCHFHDFMADVHERIAAHRQRVKLGQVKDGDPIAPVAEQLVDEAWLLCFDEFTVTDIADAMILGRLFTAMFKRGCVVVATSNVVPELLYKDGLNRSLFTPFIALLQSRMEVVKLESRADFRLEKLGTDSIYHIPNDSYAHREMNALFRTLTGGLPAHPNTLNVRGHAVHVPRQANGVARFSFDDLCMQPLGASDYLALAREYHTMLVEDVPLLSRERRNETKRFITLIDILYEQHVKLVMSAEAEPHKLYVPASHDGVEAFEFQRTVSRLTEMRSAEYLALPHGRIDSQASGDTTGIVET
ncbi:MAG: cell division protein ZapE, partial [Beijerinckiaceae bacterium]